MGKNPKHLNSLFVSFEITPIDDSSHWAGLYPSWAGLYPSPEEFPLETEVFMLCFDFIALTSSPKVSFDFTHRNESKDSVNFIK
jgi:hypothetical protein